LPRMLWLHKLKGDRSRTSERQQNRENYI
jgi:hypothetical protein